jgi:hypothetical protein
MTPLCKVQNTSQPVSCYSVHIQIVNSKLNIQTGWYNNPLTNFTRLSLVFPTFELKIETYILYVTVTSLHITPENVLEMGIWSTHQSSLQDFCVTSWSVTWKYYLRKAYTTLVFSWTMNGLDDVRKKGESLKLQQTPTCYRGYILEKSHNDTAIC